MNGGMSEAEVLVNAVWHDHHDGGSFRLDPVLSLRGAECDHSEDMLLFFFFGFFFRFSS